MKLLYTFLIATSLLFASLLNAQTIHDIEAGGGGTGNPDPYYAPQFLTIEVGDIVRWTNSGGTHNVDATLSTFPNNPEGFTNGNASSVLWVFEHTFTIPGEYDFECGAFDHNETQFGTITVTSTGVGLAEYDNLEVELYPNPSSNLLTVYLDVEILEASIRTLDQKLLESISVSGLERQVMVDIGSLATGTYFLQIRTDSGVAIRRFLKN